MQTLCHDIKLYETYEELLEYCKKKYDDIQKLSLPLFETTFPVVEINKLIKIIKNLIILNIQQDGHLFI